MRDLLDDDLAELYPVRPADDVRLARIREQLFTEQPKRRSRSWVGIAAAAVAVVMITGLVVLLRPASRDAPATMPHAPATSLTEAASLLELGQPTAKYRHIRYLVWQTYSIANGAKFSAGALEYQIDVWLPVAPDEMVLIYRNFTGGRRQVAGEQWSLNDLQPPDGYRGPVLWGSFCAATPCKEDSLKLPLGTIPAKNLEIASSALLSPFTTNEEKAGLYRKLAESPEIRWDNGTVSTEGGQYRFTIDPATGEVSGFEERRPTQENRLPDGVVTMSGTITYEWTDQRPS